MLMYKASAPGSLMLLGEYAVLHDYPALVCAIDKRISVIIEP
jgi:mevalonate kinase